MILFHDTGDNNDDTTYGNGFGENFQVKDERKS